MPRTRAKFGPNRRDNNAKGRINKPKKSCKNKLRDVERLLKKPNLPATVRVAQERVLEMLKSIIKEKAEENKKAQERSRLLNHCKKVKFFEKRKLARSYKACIKELKEIQEESEKREALLKELDKIKEKWNYIMHFPTSTGYIRLFPSTSSLNGEVSQKQDHIMKDICERVGSGELKDMSEGIERMFRKKHEKKALDHKPEATLRLDRGRKQETKEHKNIIEERLGAGPSCPRHEDDFFMDNTPSKVHSTVGNLKVVGNSDGFGDVDADIDEDNDDDDDDNDNDDHDDDDDDDDDDNDDDDNDDDEDNDDDNDGTNDDDDDEEEA